MITTTKNDNDENEEDDVTKATRSTNKHDANDDNDNDEEAEEDDEDEDDNNGCQMHHACGEWKSHLVSRSSALNTQAKLTRFIYNKFDFYFIITIDFNHHCS